MSTIAVPAVLDRALFQKLVEGEWINAHDNLALIGPTGRRQKVGWASALGHKAMSGQPVSPSTSACLGCSRNWRWPAATVAIPRLLR